jgi:hypothetical protein
MDGARKWKFPGRCRSGSIFSLTEVEQARAKAAGENSRACDELLAQSQELEDGMGLRFLYDEERRIFAIGSSSGGTRLDTSFYDLLASGSSPNESSGDRTRRSAGGTLVGFGPALRRCLRTAAAPFLDWDDVRIPNAAPLHPDA